MVPDRHHGGMKQLTRDELSRLIVAEIDKVPLLPTEIPATGAESTYARARVVELIDIYRNHGIEPVDVEIRCSMAIASVIGELGSVSGVPVRVTGEPFGSRATEAGSFLVFIDADHPAAAWLPPSIGIVFATPVELGYLATRWTLQTVDRMSPADAAAAADKL